MIIVSTQRNAVGERTEKWNICSCKRSFLRLFQRWRRQSSACLCLILNSLLWRETDARPWCSGSSAAGWERQRGGSGSSQPSFSHHTHTQSHTHTHTHTHTHNHTPPHTPHTCWFLWFMGTLHRRNGFYTEQSVCAIAYTYPTPKLSPHRRLWHL